MNPSKNMPYGRPGVEFRVAPETESPVTEVFSFGSLVSSEFVYTLCNTL